MRRKVSRAGQKHESDRWVCVLEFAVTGGQQVHQAIVEERDLHELADSLNDWTNDAPSFLCFECLNGNLYYVNRRHLLTWTIDHDMVVSKRELQQWRKKAKRRPDDEDADGDSLAVQARFLDGQEITAYPDSAELGSVHDLTLAVPFGAKYLQFEADRTQVMLVADQVTVLTIPLWMLDEGLDQKLESRNAAPGTTATDEATS